MVWERGWQPEMCRTSILVIWRVWGMRRIFRMAHVSNASMRPQRYFVVDHVSHPYNNTETIRTSGIQPDARFPNFQIFQDVLATPCQSYPTQDLDLLCCHQWIRSCSRDRRRSRPTCPSATWTVEHVAGLQNWTILVLDQLIWSPKAVASSSITDSARTSTSSISARSATLLGIILIVYSK